MSEADDVIETIRQYVACAETMDFEGRKALWDADETLPILCPEESEEPLVGWDALDEYWARSRVVMTSLEAEASNFNVTFLTEDIAFATYDNRWMATMAGPTETPPIGAAVRMNALLRKKTDGWRYFQLVEGPVDLLTMSQQAARRSATELFPDLA